MKVCIDIQSAIAQRAGVGRYTRTLVEHLSRQRSPQDALSLFYFDFRRRGGAPACLGATERAIHLIPGRVVQRAWKSLEWPPFNWFAGKADVYHFPNFILPPLTRGKSVVTIHDVAFLRYPETIEERNLRYLTRLMRKTVERADRIITVSEFTAREIQQLLGVPKEKCAAIPSGLDDAFVPARDEACRRFREQHHLPRPYLLTVGTLEPRKNIPFLVYLFESLDSDIDLVIAGMKGWKTEPILHRIETSIRRNRIHYLDYVADEDLPALYTGAEAFLFPSLYEGFGFPPLEAMRCRTPVISSCTSSLPEVLGDAAILAEPYDVEAWLEAISKVLGDSAFRTTLKAAGEARAAQFTWSETARRTWDVYRSLA
ncbi:MAG: glycosyltransferase family 4 protein [Verrucomicrobia bacterium]|nr:glycosyltransferase family 4 protein [Kiritimatiellia bacterium]MCB1102275.1 glycosyltransferase family 4 protein [Kiritimatiellia bacterium]MCP5487654.1 glycosyltransferase family 4 protein [Verrucomicrobiota bacterium]